MKNLIRIIIILISNMNPNLVTVIAILISMASAENLLYKDIEWRELRYKARGGTTVGPKQSSQGGSSESTNTATIVIVIVLIAICVLLCLIY